MDAPENILLPQLARREAIVIVEPFPILLLLKLSESGPTLMEICNDDLVEIEYVHQQGRLRRYDDLPFDGERLDHASDQRDGHWMQAELWLVEQKHVREHFRGQVKQSNEGEEAGAIRRT